MNRCATVAHGGGRCLLEVVAVETTRRFVEAAFATFSQLALARGAPEVAVQRGGMLDQALHQAVVCRMLAGVFGFLY